MIQKLFEFSQLVIVFVDFTNIHTFRQEFWQLELSCSHNCTILMGLTIKFNVKKLVLET